MLALSTSRSILNTLAMIFWMFIKQLHNKHPESVGISSVSP